MKGFPRSPKVLWGLLVLFLAHSGFAAAPEAVGPGFRYLILIELAGGNDGLNTVVPFTDPVYRSQRPTLALAPDEVLPLTDSLGLHPALAPLVDLWKAGEMAIVQGIGYADQNRSHFRSIDIWETASDARQILNQGWVTSALPSWGQSQLFLADGIVLGEARPGPFQGSPRVLRLKSVESFLQQTKGLDLATKPSGDSPDLMLWSESKALIAEAREFFQAHPGGPQTDEFGPGLGQQLATAADLIRRGIPVLMLKLTLRGFDTHVAQKEDHHQLLAELARGIVDFRRNLGPLWSQVLLMTYSEFGRRMAENGSLGTDHGSASVAFLWGGAIQGGLYGSAPDLSQLVQGDPQHTEDYRRLWATGAAFLGQSWAGLRAEPFPLVVAPRRTTTP